MTMERDSLVARLLTYGTQWNDGKTNGTLFKFSDGSRFFLADEDAAALSRPEQVVKALEAMRHAKSLLTDLRIGQGVQNERFPDNKVEGALWDAIPGVVAELDASLSCLTTAAPLPVAAQGVVTEEPHRQRFKSGIRAAIAWLHHRARFDMNDPHAKAILNTAAYHLGNALSRNCIKPENSAALPSLSRIRTDAGRDILETLKEAIDATPPSTLLAMLTGAYQEIDALRAALSTTTAAPLQADTFQNRVQPWMMACFGPEISGDRVERGDRLLEEVFELLQSGGYDPARVTALRDYVWGRETGEPKQEVGGVMVTLAAYCLAYELDMHEAGETELARIWTKVEKIRAKQAAKPVGSALPIAVPATAEERAASKEGA